MSWDGFYLWAFASTLTVATLDLERHNGVELPLDDRATSPPQIVAGRRTPHDLQKSVVRQLPASTAGTFVTRLFDFN